MAKSPDAFRTISEVADWLGVQAHVLRFWESKFAQVKPIKRAGGRRYYRPADMLLLGGLKKILHEDGLTIKGAQKLLREKGVGYVADLSQPLDDLTIAVIEGSSTPVEIDSQPMASDVGDLEQATDSAAEELSTPDEAPAPEELDPEPLETLPEPEEAAADQPDLPPSETSSDTIEKDAPLSFRARPRDTTPVEDTPRETPEPSVEVDAAGDEDNASAPPPKPERIEVALIHDHTQIEATPSAMSKAMAIRELSAEHAQQIRPLLARLTRLRASMANPRKELRKD